MYNLTTLFHCSRPCVSVSIMTIGPTKRSSLFRGDLTYWWVVGRAPETERTTVHRRSLWRASSRRWSPPCQPTRGNDRDLQVRRRTATRRLRRLRRLMGDEDGDGCDGVACGDADCTHRRQHCRRPSSCCRTARRWNRRRTQRPRRSDRYTGLYRSQPRADPRRCLSPALPPSRYSPKSGLVPGPWRQFDQFYWRPATRSTWLWLRCSSRRANCTECREPRTTRRTAAAAAAAADDDDYDEVDDDDVAVDVVVASARKMKTYQEHQRRESRRRLTIDGDGRCRSDWRPPSRRRRLEFSSSNGRGGIVFRLLFDVERVSFTSRDDDVSKHPSARECRPATMTLYSRGARRQRARGTPCRRPARRPITFTRRAPRRRLVATSVDWRMHYYA